LCSWLTGYASAETLFSGALSGALFETLVISEILKSWWFRGKMPKLYFYRDRDGVEIDIVLDYNGMLYPLEIKRSSSISQDWIKSFSKIEQLGKRVSGDVVCLTEQLLQLNSFGDRIIPVSTIN